MLHEPETYYRALLARDSRFDGLFFVGVTTTGIYCRPVCTAKTPRRDRCRFFSHPAAAEREGFRPCLRCRPELAPGHAPVDAVRRLARIAAQRIEMGALQEGHGLEALAAGLGVGSRQLRRVIRSEFGASPIELAQTRRLLLAKQLLAETQLPITRVAFAAGFQSVRRFNALFQKQYRLTPGAMRRAATSNVRGDAMRLTLAYRPPYAWPAMLQFLRGRATQGVEHVAEHVYQRTVAIGDFQGWLRAVPIENRSALSVEVAIELTPVLPALLGRLRHLFDLDARPDVILDALSASELQNRIQLVPGLRLPGAFDGFEVAVRAILGQRISVRAATTVAGRLAAEFGESVVTPYSELDRLFPTPAVLRRAPIPKLIALGIPETRAAAIVALAGAVEQKKIELAPGPDPQHTIDALQELSGIGPWTAHYIAMRALGWPDAFPAGDLVLRNRAEAPSERALERLAEAWRPWRAYAAIQLWNSVPHSQPLSTREVEYA